MTASNANTSSALGDEPDDDLPDLTESYWVERFDKAVVQRGRPKAERTKVSTTIRLSPEVVEHFKAGGPGWQTRIDEALRKAIAAE